MSAWCQKRTSVRVPEYTLMTHEGGLERLMCVALRRLSPCRPRRSIRILVLG
jgi:hypothetical protein